MVESDTFEKSIISEPAIDIKPIEFRMNGEIPEKFWYECDNIIPSFGIENIPSRTKSLAFIIQDEDTPGDTFYNFILYNISKKEKSIGPNMKSGIIAKNSFRTKNYNGPCPISGRHYYSFTIFALDRVLEKKEYEPKELLNKIFRSTISSTTIIAYAEKNGQFAIE